MNHHLASLERESETLALPLSTRPEAILEAISEIIMYVDVDKVYRWANPAGFAFFGDDVIGKKASFFFVGESRIYETVDPLFDGDENVIRLESWQRRKDGEIRLLFWNCRVLKDSNSNIIGAISTAHDMTKRRIREDYREMSREILQQLNQPGQWQDLLNTVIDILKTRTGFAAVGLRLRAGNDFPYYAQNGFSKEFLLAKNTLRECAGKDDAHNTQEGNVYWACVCDLVLSGKADLSSPSFTKGGSFWTNNSIALLDPSAEQHLRHPSRNLCMQGGYASLALIPIRNKEGTVGLLHFADQRKGRFTLEIIELLEDVASHMGEALMRKQTEEALQKSEEQHRLLLQFLPVGVVIHAPDTSVLLANDEAEILLGIPREVMQGKKAMDPYWHFVREDGSQMPLNEYPVSRVLATGKPIENVIMGVDRYIGASRVWLLVNAFSQMDDAGKLLQVGVTFSDLTERKRLEAALEQRLVALTRPLDHPECITFSELFDLETIQHIQDEFSAATGVASVITHTDGTPITRPSNFCRLCRDIIRNTEIGCRNCYHSDAILGRYHPEGPVIQPCLSGGLWDAGASISIGDRHIANWLIGQVRDETQSEEKIKEYAHTIGADEKEVLAAYREVPAMSISHFQQIAQALFTFANQLSTTAYQNIQQARFITERQQAEVALNKERLQLRTLIDNLPYGVYVKDADCRFLVANKILAQYMGVSSPEALMGHTDQQHHPEALARQYTEDDMRIIREGVGLYGKEESVKIAERDDLRYWSTTKVPMKDATGQVIGLVGIGIDITEKKAAEKAILDMAEAKSKFTSTVSHELRSPLAMIKEATNLVLEGVLGSLNDGQKEMLEITKSNVDRLARMINNVLEFKKMEAGKTTYDLRKNKINELVKEANKGAILFAGERKSDLVMDLEADLPEIVFDRDKIMQVLINLTANAIKYSESGPIVIKTRLKKGEIQISVQDYGHGIAPEEREEIFKPFSQGKNKKKKGGTGLGLAIVKEIVLAHHGRLWVESEPNKGSTFYFTLPV